MWLDDERVTRFMQDGAAKLRLAVIGDVMLDRYYFGEVKRISPEAPVPVNRVKRAKNRLGGAANVAHNLARLGCQVALAGVTGPDSDRDELIRLLEEVGADASGLVVSAHRPTTTKLRILGAGQQMVRLDFEEPGILSEQEESDLRSWFTGALARGLDGVILSDYAKGVCTPAFCQWVIEACHAHEVPILVDPKGMQWEKYQGADLITPNVKEMGEAVGIDLVNEDATIADAAEEARALYQLGTVVVTRSEKGLSIIGPDTVAHVPTYAREVFDVSGAGDTVAAVLLAGVAGGLPVEASAHLANLAAGVVVARTGTYAISHEELSLALERRDGHCPHKVMTRNELVQKVKQWRNVGETVVFTNGCFDLLHTGHVTYLEKAAALGDHLILGLNTDASVQRLKGETRPLVAEMDRARVLAALGCIDAVTLFDEDTPAELISQLRPDILVKGGDYTPEQVAGRESAGRVEIIPFEAGYSTTGIVQKIAQLVREGKL